jgi:hypothetical protein
MMPWIFLHIPRCGGTSVKRTLHIAYSTCKMGLRKFPTIHKPVGQVPPEKGQRFFTFVRDPRDRVVSLCAYALDYRKSKGSEHVLTPDEFAEWLFHGERFWYTVPQAEMIRPYTEQLEYIGRYEKLEDDFMAFANEHLPKLRITKLLNVNSSNRRSHKEYYTDPMVEQRFLEEYWEDVYALGYANYAREEELCQQQ